MRIAVSGTHCSGKSTLVEAFLRAHSDFVHEPEPYTVLVEELGEEFGAEPTGEEFLQQLEFNCERLGSYTPDSVVIFERCPADFLAYILALEERTRKSKHWSLVDWALGLARSAIRQLDLIAFLPLDDIEIDVSEEEDQALRSAMDRQLAAILLDDKYSLFASATPRIIELTGSTTNRLRLLENAASLRKLDTPESR